MEKQAFINMDTLVIDGRRYTIGDLNNLSPELDPVRIATEEVDDMLVFLERQSPFSNLHKFHFVVQGLTHDCTEQFYLQRKAVFIDDLDTINAVMGVNISQEIKCMSHTLNSKLNAKMWMESTANNAMIGEVKVMFCHNTTRQETSV